MEFNMPTNIVAVYGTLREGLENHELLAECKRIGLGWLTGYRMYNLGDAPGIISTRDDSGRIRVEWYKVTDEILASLDEREGYDPKLPENSQHIRKTIFSPYGRGWIYLYNRTLSNADYMEAGDWERYIRTTKLPQDTQNQQDQDTQLA
jgi:gamma-glutamylcyclotransferase (GGCT)/AIG2-like uncharacterized protein YtfP